MTRATTNSWNFLHSRTFPQPSRDMPLPGNVNPVDRFQRAAYYLAMLPKAQTTRQAVASVMAIIRNVSVPFGSALLRVRDLQHRIPHSHRPDAARSTTSSLTTSPNVIWIELDGLDLTEGADPQAIDPYDESLIGNVTARFTPHQSAF